MPDTAPKTRTRTAAKGGRSKGSTASTGRSDARTRKADRELRFKAEALDAVSTAIMMVDRDLVITYMNEAAHTLMRESQDGFRQVWPGFDPDALVGSCIDQFHRDPSHQRRLLDDPSNLPHQADIEVAGLSFGLKVTAQITDSGDYVGCCLEWEDLTRLLEVDAKLSAIDRSQALIEFDLDGNVLSCNDNFLATMGYSLDEITGRHHRMFVDPTEAASPEYAAFWDRLRTGESIEGEFKRLDKSGNVVWLRASYNSILDRSGRPVGFFKVASDITEAKLRGWDLEAKMASVDRAQALIEFDLDGNVEACNDNFQTAMGYTLDEITGKHHRMFVDPTEAASPEYAAFWDRLRTGESIEGEFKRLDKSGNVVWLRASYNPVLGEDGKPVSFFKIASDITEAKLRGWDLEAKMASVDRGQASIEFDLDGNIQWCNDNFAAAMGYTLDEIKGKHHRIFVDPTQAADRSYLEFWETLNRGQYVEGEFKRVTKAGETIWLRASYNPVLGEDGRPVKFFKIASDITDEKRLRDQIEQIVGRTSQVMSGVSAGDLTQVVEGDYRDSLGLLQEATNTSIRNLGGLVSQIRASATSMSSSAKEVAAANQDLSRRTEAQASSLEETASSMEEMTATVQQNADNAREASQLAIGAREQAQSGGDVVGRAVDAVRAISESSKKIADIIGVIDEIAFQTNLLALNAAVEAARAGDQGRGFAVVASEVRNLAQRSAGAAKEIKALIQDSLEKVDDGSSLVNQSGTQLAEIVGSVTKVSDIIAEIAAASEEQSAGINQVNQAVVAMDQGTQQNAAMVEQAAAASESVQQQSHALLGLTQQFRLAGAEAATVAPGPGAVGPGAVPIPKAHAPNPGAAFDPVGLNPAPTAPAAWSGDAGDEAWQEF
ncbi:MAG: methyl-accepting chemotaxis protein [Actinomycetota bacterium]